MSLPPVLRGRLRIPVVGAPMFIISQPELVVAQCTAGIVGSFPALNARPADLLDTWLTRIRDGLAHDLDLCVKHQVPIVITSLGAREDLNQAVHGYGGIVLHDVINVVHARKAIDKGADGLIAVCAGAGGHAGMLSPFALIDEIRAWWDGPLLLSGAIANGRSVLAAQALGADLAYIGSAFIATAEAHASDRYKSAVVEATAADIIYTNLFTGVLGNYLRSSIVNAGLDPDNLPTSDPSKMNFGSASTKAWRDIWGCGQGIGAISAVTPVAALVDRLVAEYTAARQQLRG